MSHTTGREPRAGERSNSFSMSQSLCRPVHSSHGFSGKQDRGHGAGLKGESDRAKEVFYKRDFTLYATVSVFIISAYQ